jgi:hypothetical protein
VCAYVRVRARVCVCVRVCACVCVRACVRACCVCYVFVFVCRANRHAYQLVIPGVEPEEAVKRVPPPSPPGSLDTVHLANRM